MNKQVIYWILCVVMTIAWSCTNNNYVPGVDPLGEGDESILVGCDTFPLHSDLRGGAYIFTTPDSFLLGECESMFGSLHADLLTQMACPEGFKYPDGAVVDSVCLFLYYTSWYGNGRTPLSLNVYEMDGEVLEYDALYSCFDNPDRFCSKKTCLVDKPRIVVASAPVDSVYNSSTGKYVPFVRFTLNDAFRDRFFAIKDFSNQNTFNQAFKGLYITSEFGGGTILHVSEVSMAVYYHYDYRQIYDSTTITEIDVKGFYANSEVRQINRYELINNKLEYLALLDDSMDFVLSPGYIFTELRLPIRHMCDSIFMSIGEKRPYFNQAKIAVEVLNADDDEDESDTDSHWAEPSEYMLLVKESALSRFFLFNELPTDTCALLERMTIDADSLGNIGYYYEYDLSSMLTHMFREEENKGVLMPDTLTMVLVPVDVTTTQVSSTSTEVTSVKHKQTVSATVIKSANVKSRPMQMEIVYSGF